MSLPWTDTAMQTKSARDRMPTLRRILRIANPAWLCVISGIALSLLGVVAIDLARTLSPHGLTEVSAFDGNAIKQLVFLGIGLFAGALVAIPHYRFAGMIAWLALIGLIGLLVFLLLPFAPESLVTPRNGTRGWIDLGPFDLQPSELAKIAYVLVIARYLRYREDHRRFLGLVPLAIITAIPVGLITLQPDLGTASLFVPSLFAMLLAAGARLRHLVLIVLAAALAAPAMYPLLKPHQKTRIIGLIRQVQGDRTSAHDINFQSYTAQMLVGAGGLTGMRDAESRAAIHYSRLPEGHNDMVFAVIVNRFGMLGGIGMLCLHGLWIFGAFWTAVVCREPFGRLVAVGLAAFIAAQVVINVGMTVGLLPIIGITLPFVSYGGSSLIACWLMTGLVFAVGLHWPLPPYRPSFEFKE